MRKGQITVFVVVGLVLLVLAGIFFFIQQTTVEEIDNPNSHTLEQSSVTTIVETCTNRIAEEAMQKMGTKNIDNPEFGKEKIAQYLKDEIDQELPTCINNFSILEEKNIQVSEGEPSSQINIGDTTTTIKVKYPLIITTSEETITIDEFITSITFDYKAKKDTIDTVLNNIAPTFLSSLPIINTGIGNIPPPTNPSTTTPQITGAATLPEIENMKLSELTWQASQKGFTYDLIYKENGQTKLLFHFPQNGAQPELTHTVVMNREQFEPEDITILAPIPEFTYTGSPITHQIKPSYNMIFYESSEFVSINKEGLMTISGDIPTGTNKVLIEAMSENGEKLYAYAIIHN